MSRSCGECTLCCTVLAVQDIEKPSRTTCEHECDLGCAIYDARPYSCKRFECLWLQRRLPIWARPDKIDVIFDIAKPRITGKKMPILVIESKLDAHKDGRLTGIIDAFAKDRDVLVVRPDDSVRPYIK